MANKINEYNSTDNTNNSKNRLPYLHPDNIPILEELHRKIYQRQLKIRADIEKFKKEMEKE